MKNEYWSIKKYENGYTVNYSYRDKEDKYVEKELIFSNAKDIYTWLSNNGLVD